MAMPDSSFNMSTDTGTSRSIRTQAQTATGMRTQDQTQSQTHGSATQTITNTNSIPQDHESLVLRLRGAHDPITSSSEGTNTLSHNRRRRHIQWDANVVDNEGLGRKKSKVCCIYHKPKAVGESSDESSSSSSDSDSDSASDSGGGNGAGASDSDSVMDGARPAKGTRKMRRGRKEMNGNDRRRRPSPNAYEKMPRYDVKPLSQQPGM